LDIQTAMAVVPPVPETNDSFETHHPAVVQFVCSQKLSVIAKVLQKPAELPEGAIVAIEPGADVTAGKGGRVEDIERRGHTGIRGVAGGPEVDHSGPVQAFDQRISIYGLTETLDFGAHDGLLSQTPEAF
jgi:hypothetical protein